MGFNRKFLFVLFAFAFFTREASTGLPFSQEDSNGIGFFDQLKGAQEGNNSTIDCPFYTSQESCLNSTGCCWQNYFFFGFTGSQCIDAGLGASSTKLLLGEPISTPDSDICSVVGLNCKEIDTSNYCTIMKDLSKASNPSLFKVNSCQCFSSVLEARLSVIILLIFALLKF